MIKRVAINIMQNFAPALLVVCVFLCLSFSCTFPLHRGRSNYLAEMLNRSQKCGAASRAKKMSTGEQVFGSQEDSVSDTEAAKRKLSGNDLRQYEQLVIMKKYPYLDMKEFELKFGPSVKNAKYRGSEIAAAGECKLTDDGPRVEIVSRGISGFAIPKSPKTSLKAVGNTDHLQLKNLNLRENSRVWKNIKDFA